MIKDKMSRAEIKARDYIRVLLKNLGFSCVTIFENEDKNLCGKTFIELDEFLNQLKTAFIVGHLSANEKCEGKTCFNCDHYNGLAHYENGFPVIGCRLGGLYQGADACEDYEKEAEERNEENAERDFLEAENEF